MGDGIEDGEGEGERGENEASSKKMKKSVRPRIFVPLIMLISVRDPP
jgi:hypothetical protein